MSTKTNTGAEQRRRGRPPRPVKVIRRNRVVTMVTDEELRLLTARAEEQNASISAVVHRMVKRSLNRQPTGGNAHKH